MTEMLGLQRFPPARGGTAQRKIFHLENWCQLIHPGPSSSRSRFFMESSQLYAATLTHYSTEPLTTGTDYNPLLLLLALAGVCTRTQDRQGTPARSASKTSLPRYQLPVYKMFALGTFKMFWSSKRCGLS